MTATVTTLAGSGPVGPGIAVFLHTTLVGPIEVDSYWTFSVVDHATSNVLASGLKATGALTSVTGILGLFDHGPASSTAPLVPQSSFEAAAAGTACDLTAILHHPNFATEDGPVTVTGYTWDPVSGLGALIGYGVSLSASGTGGLGQILASVRRTY